MRRLTGVVLAFGLGAGLLLAPLPMDRAMAAGAPGQPATGPGGSDYAIGADAIEKKVFGAGNGKALAFYPRARADRPRPVVVFLHAPGAISPSYYGAWLSHLARRGDVVIYPLYEQAVGAVPFEEMTGEALKGVRAALDGLAADKVDLDLGRLSLVGHGGGAVIAANLAALSGRDELPPARLLFGAMPARPGAERVFGPPLSDLSTIPDKTVAVMLVGDRDQVGGDRGARQILAAASHLGQTHRLIARAGSDNHGTPAVTYNHQAAIAPDEAFDLSRIPGAAEPPPAAAPAAGAKQAGGARQAGGDKQAGAKPSPEEVRRQREQQRKRTAALWRVGHEERRSLMDYEGREVTSANYAIWKIYDLAREVILAGGDAMTLKRDPRLYDMGLWADGWPLRRLSVETPKPAAPSDGAEVSQSTPIAPAQPRLGSR